MSDQNHQHYQKIVNAVSMLALIALAVFVLWCWNKGILTSQEKMQAYIHSFGRSGELIFILIQIVQVIFPFIPGGVSCIGGVVLFGPWKGFWMNYIGICTGSILVFILAKHFGPPLMHRLFKEKTIEKYRDWTDRGNRFTILFTLAVLLPGFPDDFLCYLAGTTSMRYSTFMLIMLLGKPLSLAVYSVGIDAVLKLISGLIS